MNTTYIINFFDIVFHLSLKMFLVYLRNSTFVGRTQTLMVNLIQSLSLQVDSDLHSYSGKLVDAAANKGYDCQKDDE